jgi:hypothetical protein
MQLMDAENSQLFSRDDLAALLDGLRHQAAADVDALDAAYLMKVAEHDLIDALAAKYHVEPLELQPEKKSAEEPREVLIALRGEAAFLYGETEAAVRGAAVEYVIPFTGEPRLFHCRPLTHSWSFPFGWIVGQELHFEIRGSDTRPEAVKRECDEIIAAIGQYLQWQRSMVDKHNEELHRVATLAVQQRKARLQKNTNLATALGVPVRRRGVPGTFAVPAVRLKPRIELPSVPSDPQEPVLADEHYQFILKVLQDMGIVLERNPTTFARMEEEALRDVFLIPLNGHFEGQATGETFNGDGKTDILIRYEGRNVFIAECKFWHGEKALLEAVDQLLGYTSWRDTKTAILLFNRNRNLSNVLGQIPSVLRGHPNYKRDMPINGETSYRCVLRHRDDQNRELILTVLVFDVPIRDRDTPPEQ